MSTLQGIFIDSERPVYSENLLAVSSMYDTAQTISVTAGTGTAVISDDRAYEGASCLKVNWIDMLNPLAFHSATDTTTVEQGGKYIFAHRVFCVSTNPTQPPNVAYTVKVFKNAVLFHEIQCFADSATFIDYDDNVWNCFAQSFTLSEGDILSWKYEITAGQTLLGDVTFYFDGLKLEYDDREIQIPSIYSKPKTFDTNDIYLHIAETQWDVLDIGAQVVSNGASVNLLSLINNATHKNVTNTDVFDELNIVTNAIKTTYRGNKIIHTIRVTFNIITGTDQHYQLQIRRAVDDSVVYRARCSRDADETIQTVEMTTRTLSAIDPFVVDGFYLAFVNNSGSSATIDDALSVVVISHYQKGQKP